MGLSFFPVWKASSPSLNVAPVTVRQSTFVPSYFASTTTTLCFGIPYVLMCAYPTSNKKLTTSRKKGSGMSWVRKAFADKEYLP